MSNDIEERPAEERGERLTCRVCNAESEWTEGFVPATNVVHGPHHVCVTCVLYRQKYRNYYLWWFYWTAATVAFGYYLSGSIMDAVLFAIGGYALLYLAIVIHELGHLLAALAVGVHVPAISFGGGLRAKVLRFRDAFLILSPSPSEGMIITTHSTGEHYRKKTFLILLSGPLVNAIAALLGIAALITFWGDLSKYASAGIKLWIWINTYLAITNLFSFSHKTAFGTVQSDGGQMWGLRKKTDEEIEEILRQRNVILASLEFQLGDMEKSLAIIEKAIEDGEDSVHTRSLVTATLAETGQLERGIVINRAYLESTELNVMERALLQNNLAFMLYLTDDDEALKEADTLSQRAMEVLPMIMAVRSTRASVLVATGRVEEGVAMLTDKRFKLETPSHQATVNLIRATGLARLGDREEASKSLNAARSLDPENRHLPEAEAALAAMEA
ncbi:MAG: site-2 protease family protein [Pseudomonadota bacterium]